MEEKSLRLTLGSHPVRYVLTADTEMERKYCLSGNGLALSVEHIMKEI